MANEISSKWYYPLTEVSQDKRVALPGVKPGYASELAGFDGQLSGGLRPFSGFKNIYDLDMLTSDGGTTAHAADSVNLTYHNTSTHVTDFFPITFNIDFDTYGYGFVYRAQRPNQGSSATFTFSGAVGVNETIQIIDNSGTPVTKVYKAASSGTSGTESSAVSATATFTFNAVAQLGGTITLIGSAGLSKTYMGSNDDADSNGTVDATGNIIFKVGASNTDSSANLRTAILATTGHNGAISVTDDGGGKLTLTQNDGGLDATQGLAGNKAIVVSTTPDFNEKCSVNPPSAFTGGIDSSVIFRNDTGANENAAALKVAIEASLGHNNTVAVEVVGAKVTLTQATVGESGDTAITVSSSWNSACSVNVPAKFTGGSTTDKADIFLDFYLAECDVYSTGNVIKANISSTEPMDVESTGRMVFVGVRGVDPILFYVTEDPPGIDETSTSHSIGCIAGGDCTSSSDGSSYCPAIASLTFDAVVPSTNIITSVSEKGIIATRTNSKAEASWKFTERAEEGSAIQIESSDGRNIYYKAKGGATNGTIESSGGVDYVLFNSGATAFTTGQFTFSGAMPANETIKLIDTNGKERTYEAAAGGSPAVKGSSETQATATFTFEFKAVEGSTLTLTDNSASPVTRIYKCMTDAEETAGTYENGQVGNEADSSFLMFKRGDSPANSATNLVAAINNAANTIGITAAVATSTTVNLTQDTAALSTGTLADGNTNVGSGSSFTNACSVNPPSAFTGGGFTVEFTRGSSAADTAAGLKAAVINALGHENTIATTYTPSSANLTLTQSVYDGTKGGTAIAVSGSWNANCSVNPPSAFGATIVAATEATAAATNFKAAVDSASGHNSTGGFGTTTLTFDNQPAAGSEIQLISSVGTDKTVNYKATATLESNGTLDGTDVLFYNGSGNTDAGKNEAAYYLRKAINSANGHNASPAKATATFNFFENPGEGPKVTIVSTDGTSRLFEFSTGGETTGDVGGGSQIFVGVSASASPGVAAQQFASAVNSSNAFGGSSPKIIATVSAKTVTLTQQTEGVAGNSTITYNVVASGSKLDSYINPAPTAFSGGTVDWNGTTLNTEQRLSVEEDIGVVGKLTFRQLETTSGGNTTVTTDSAMNTATSGGAVADFAGGGSASTSSNLRFTVTANGSGTAGQVNMQQSLGDARGNKPIFTFFGFNNNTSPPPPERFAGGGTMLTNSTMTLVDGEGNSHIYIYDRSSTNQNGDQDTDGRYIIGIQEELSLTEQVKATVRVIAAASDNTKITAYAINDKKLGLKQLVLGTVGNTSVVLSTDAAKLITKTDFTGGVGPQSASAATSVASVSCAVRHSLVIEEETGPGPKPLLEGPFQGWQNAYVVDTPSPVTVPSNARLIFSVTAPNSGIYKSIGEPLFDGGYTIDSVLYNGGTNAEIVETYNQIQIANNNQNDAVYGFIDCDFDYGGEAGDGDEVPETENDGNSGTDVDDPTCSELLELAIPHIGISPGGVVNPGPDPFASPNKQAVRRTICNYKLNSITDGNQVNQLPIIEIFTYTFAQGNNPSHEFKIWNCKMDIYVRKKNDAENPFVEGTNNPEGYGNFQLAATNVNLKIDEKKRNEMYTYVSNSKGGKFAQFVPNGGRDIVLVNEEAKSFATAAGYTDTEKGGNSHANCYITHFNMASVFGCDNFSAGEYQVQVVWRTMCCEPVQNKSSEIITFTVDPAICEFEGEGEEKQVSDLKRLKKGNYVFSYVLYDSKTGRRSALTEVLTVKEEDFTADENFAFIDLVYDKTKYDHAYFYRSVNTQDAGGVSVAGVLSLDRIAKLQDYIIDGNQPTNTDYRRAVYPYKLEDMSILYQPTYRTETPVFDEKMPAGGSMLWYGNTLLVSRIKNAGASSSTEERIEDVQRGIGELRWSSMMENSPEMFSPFNRYVPVVPSNEIIALKTLGDVVYGFSRDRAYNIRKDSGMGIAFMKVMDLHEGFGTTGANSLEGVGSSMYYMTPKGVKALNTKGQLDDVRAFDHHISTYWPRDLSNVHMSYDPTGSVMFILDPSKEEVLCLWFNTGKSTMLKDMSFTQVKKGPWPNNPDIRSDELVDRAMFLQNPPSETGAQGFKPRIYSHDYKYERTIAGSGTSAFNGKTRLTLMDGQGDTRFSTHGSVSSKVLTIDNADGTKVSNAWVGGYVYVMDSSTSSYIGKKSKIIKIVTPDIDEIGAGGVDASSKAVLTLADATLDSLPAGSRVCVSPVYMRWIGHNIGLNSEEGTQFGSSNDYHTLKHMDSLEVAFTDVVGPPSTDSSKDARYSGLAFKGSNPTPVDNRFPTDLNNAKVQSVQDNESVNAVAFGEDTAAALAMQGMHGVKGSSIAPGLEVICPDLDFRLLSGIVIGKVLPTTRNTRPNVGM